MKVPSDRLAQWVRRPPVRIVAFLDQGIVSAGNFTTGVLMARAFGAHEFGSYTLAWLIVEFVASLQFASVIQPMLYIGAKEDHDNHDRYYSAIAVQQACLAIATALLVWLALTAIGAHVDADLAHLALPVCFATVTFQGYNFFRRYFFMRDRPLTALASDLLRVGLQVGGILALSFLSWPATATTGVWIVAAACTASTAIGIAGFGRFHCDRATFGRLATRHWAFSKWLLPSAVMYWTTSQAFILASGLVLGAAATGTLMIAISITGLIAVLMQALDNFAPKQAAQAFVAHGRDGLLRYLTRLSLFVASLIAAFVLLVCSDTDAIIRTIYGRQFEGLGYIVHWMCATSVVYASSVLLGIWAAAIERTHLIFVSCASATLFAVLAAYPLTSTFGMQGVLWGALIVEVIKALALIVALVRWRTRGHAADYHFTALIK